MFQRMLLFERMGEFGSDILLLHSDLVGVIGVSITLKAYRLMRSDTGNTTHIRLQR